MSDHRECESNCGSTDCPAPVESGWSVKEGDVIELTVADGRWWARLIHFLAGAPPPTITYRHVVTEDWPTGKEPESTPAPRP